MEFECMKEYIYPFVLFENILPPVLESMEGFLKKSSSSGGVTQKRFYFFYIILVWMHVWPTNEIFWKIVPFWAKIEPTLLVL